MKKLFSLAFAVLTCASFGLQAAIVHLSGFTVDYYYDDSDPGFALYGTLTVVGDSIFANPTDFLAQAEDGSSDSISATATVQVVAKSGYSFDSVLVAQQGDYQMSGSGASVSQSATLTIDSNTSAVTTSVPLASSDDFTLQDNLTHGWYSDVTVDLSGAAWSGVMDIDLTLESLLNASTGGSGELAWIQNKFVGGGMVTIMTTPVPLPATVWLMASGLIGLYGVSRKKAERRLQ